MKMTLDQAESLVANCPYAEWNQWDISIFNDKIDGFTNKNGAWKDGKWQVKTTISLNADGEYDVPRKYKQFMA